MRTIVGGANQSQITAHFHSKMESKKAILNRRQSLGSTFSSKNNKAYPNSVGFSRDFGRMGDLSYLSPIQESLSDQTGNRSQSPYSSIMARSHLRKISDFSSLNDLWARQRQLNQNKNANARIKIGGNVSSDCVMTAIPESHFVRRNTGPTDADMKLLGLRLPNINDNNLTDQTNQTDQTNRFENGQELRDESPMDGISFDDERSEISGELRGDQFSEDDESSVGIPVAVTTSSFDDVSDIGTKLRGISDREIAQQSDATKKAKFRMQLKKPIDKFAVKIWHTMKPLLYKSKLLFHKKEVLQFERSKGVLT